jgi:hypothetical protein
MQSDRDVLLAFIGYGKLSGPSDAPRAPRRGNRRWRWRWRPAPTPPGPLAPDPVPAGAVPLDIHEYLELEFTVGREGRR